MTEKADSVPRAHLAGFYGWVCAALVLLLPRPSVAVVEGVTPTKVTSFRLFGSHSATGAAVMIPGPFRKEINSVLVPQASQVIDDMPFDHRVEAAYLFWSGATPRSNRIGPPDGPDFDVDFTTADGTFYNDLSALDDPTGFGRCLQTSQFGGFYYCRRDVTAQVAAQGLGNANGTYTVGDLDSDPGTLNGSDGQAVFAQAKYAGWSLLVVWSSDTEEIRRDVVLYDGFARLDEDDSSAGQVSFSIGDFTVGSPALGRLSLFAMEGDSQLGVPPQDLTGCPTCFDYIEFRGPGGTGARKLSNGRNPENNSFNSSWDGQSGIDIDTYDLFGLIDTGDSSADITVSSGDGVFPLGDGESFFLGWTIMSIDSLTPRFRSAATKKEASPASASAGQTVFYSIDVVNDGSDQATGVVLRDPIPAGAVYVPDSTRVDGSPVPDVSGQSPLENGLSLGTIPTSTAGDNSRQVTFQVRVDDSACGGSIANTATLNANEVSNVSIGPIVTTVDDVSIEPPTLSVSAVTAPPVGPGSIVRYAVDFPNSSGQDIGGVTLELAIPSYLDVDGSGVFATSGNVSLVGGTLNVDDIVVREDGSTRVTVLARVFSESELNSAGVADDDIDGLVISAQGLATGGCGAPELTDDPDVVGAGQPTELVLVFRPLLSTSVKEVTDLNGAPLEPNDVVRYRIVLENSGNRAAAVELEDPIPAFTAYVAGSTLVDGVTRSDVGGAFPFASGASVGSIPAGGSREIIFDVAVDELAPNGTAVMNTAEVTVPVEPDANVTLVSPTLQVFAAPELSTSRKIATDLTAPVGVYEPGDAVRYEIVLENTGNRPATAVEVSDRLPAEVSFVSATDGGVESGGVVTWAVGAIPAGESRTLNVEVRLRSPLANGTVVLNEALVRSDELPEQSLRASFTVESQPVLRVTKIAELASVPAEPGDRVLYRLRIQNDGNALAEDVRVVDPIDPALVNVVAPAGTVGTGTVEFDSGSDPRLASIGVGPGNAVELLIEADVRSPIANGTVVSNQASVSTLGVPPVDSDDPTVSGSADPTVFVVSSEVALTLSKRVQDLSPGTPYGPGDRIRYSIEVTVGGTSPIESLVIIDPLPEELEDPSAIGGTVSGNEARFALGTLNPGDSTALVVDATVRSSTVDGTVVANQATAESATLAAPVRSDGDAEAPGAQTTDFTVVAESRAVATLAVERVGDDDSEYNPGDRVRYTARIENSGNVDATGVTLEIPISSELTVVDSGGGLLQPGSVQFTASQVPALAAIPPGTAVELTVVADLLLPLDDGTVVSTQGSVTGFSQPVNTDDPATAAPDDATAFTVRSAPLLDGFTKSVADVSGEPLVTLPNDTLRYTLTLRNDGDATARNLVVRDPIDSALTVSTPANATFDGSALLWNGASEPALLALVPGEEVQLVFDATVSASANAGQRVSNQATVTAGSLSAPSDDPQTPTVDDATDVFIGGGADLGASTKTVTDLGGNPVSSAAPGDVVRYVLVIENRGSTDATSVTVTDVLPSELQPVDAPNANVSGQTVTWSTTTDSRLQTLAAGDAVTLTVDVRLDDDAPSGAVILNQASVIADELSGPLLTDADPSTVAKEATALEVAGRAVFAGSTKVFVDPTSGAPLRRAAPGDEVRIVITLQNLGGVPATDVEVLDPLHLDKLTTIVVRDGGSLAGDSARWTGLTVDPGATRQLRIDARIRNGLDNDPLSNQAFIGVDGATPSVPTDDPAQPGDADPTVLEILSPPDLSGSTKDVSVGALREVSPGETFDYRIEVDNGGSGTARGLSVSDELAPELEFVAVSDGGSFDGSTRAVTVDLPDLAPRSSRVVTLTVRSNDSLANGTVIANQARISASNAPDELSDDPLVGSADSPTEIRVVSGPRLRVAKTVTPSSANRYRRPGDELTYTIRVSNVGNAAATNVEIRDSVDPSLLVNLAPVTPGVIAAGEVLFGPSANPELVSLAAGETFEAVFAASIADDVPNGTPIANQGRVRADELSEVLLSDDPSTPEPTDPTVVLVEFPVLVFTKELDRALPIQPGDEVAYTLSIRNDGTLPALNVRLEDPLPGEIIDVESSPPAQILGDRLVWTAPSVPQLASLDPGASLTFTLSGRVDPGTADGTRIANQGEALADDVPLVRSDWPSTPAPNDPTEFEVNEVPSLAAAKVVLDDDDRIVNPGQTFSYSIELLNQGTSPARELFLVDPIPDALEVVTADGAEIDAERGEVSWALGTLDPGESLAVRLEVRVRMGTINGLQLANQARVTAAGLMEDVLTDDPTVPGDADPTLVSVSALPLLNGTVLFAEDLNGGTLQPGDRIRYTLRVVNVGTFESVATRASLPLPPFTQYVPASTTLNGASVSDSSDGPLRGSSPLFDSMMTVSRRPGTPLGVVLPTAGETPSDEESIIRFEAQVDPRALPGTVIETQATIVSEGTSAVASDDCTRSVGEACDADSLVGEPTVLVVGGGSTFAVEKGWSLAEDLDGNGRPDPGDRLRYRISTVNLGAEASEPATLTDRIAQEATFVSGSVTLDGVVLTDGAGDDAGTFNDRTATVDIGAVAPGERKVVTLDVRVGDTDVLVNQASLSAAGRTYLSDGDPSIAGDQPTRIVIDRTAQIVSAYLSATDRNGGVVEAGDPIRYTLTLVNEGGVALEAVDVLIDREAVFGPAEFATPDDAALVDESPRWSATLPAGARRELEVEAPIIESVEQGRLVSALGVLPALGVESEPVDLVIGGGAGSATLNGRVFLDRGERNGTFEVNVDEPVAGFTVALVPEGAEGRTSTRDNPDLAELAIRTVVTGPDGRYQTGAVPPGRYRVLAATSSGAVFAEGAVEATSGLVEVPALAIDPSGIIYEVDEGAARPVAGARVFLVDETTGEDLDPVLLAAGQQGQVTTVQGFYRFDLRLAALPGQFRLRVEPPSTNLFYPSGLRPPVGASAQEPLGEPAPGGPASPFDFPQPSEDSTYYLRFELDVDTEDVTNNHVPLDRLADAIRLTKQVNRRRASVGDVVTYTITITNPLSVDLTTEDVGARLVDLLPEGLQWANDSEARRTVVAEGEDAIEGTLPVARRTARSIEFAPMELPALSTTTIRYYGVVGLRARGELTNRAELRNASNLAISNRGSASLRVVDDPIFDEGTVLGRVFCDDDGDGIMHPSERGLPGARVYLDTGFYADTDMEGNYHFRGVRPGRHVIKADPNTMPPGSEATNDRVRDFIITRGLLAKIDFAVRCGWEPVAAGTRGAFGEMAEVVIDTSLPAISINGIPQDAVVVDAVLSSGTPDFDAPLSSVRVDEDYQWHIRTPARADLARWALSVFSESGDELWRAEGDGAPPRLLRELPELEVGAPHLYRLAVQSREGEISEGRWRRLVLRPPETDQVPVEPAAPETFESFDYPASVLVNGEPQVTGAERMTLQVPIGPDGLVQVDVRQENGRRTSVIARTPFEREPERSAVSASLAVSGNLSEGTLNVGGAPANLGAFNSECTLDAASHVVREALIEPPVEIAIRSPSLQAWTIRIFNPDGTVLTDLSGDGAPAEKVSWDGRNVTGNPVARAGTYRFRCLLTDDHGGQFVGPMTAFRVSAEAAEEDSLTVYNMTFSGEDYPKEDLTPEIREELGRAAEALGANPAARVVIEVHEHPTGGRVQAQMRTVRLSAAVKQTLEELGVDEGRIELKPLGANQPIMPGDSRVAQMQNRRVLITVVAPPRASEAPYADESLSATEPRARIAGQLLGVREEGSFEGMVTAEPDGMLAVELVGRDGRRWFTQLPLRGGVPQSQARGALEAGAPEGELLGSTPEEVRSPVRAKPPASGVGSEDSAIQLVGASREGLRVARVEQTDLPPDSEPTAGPAQRVDREPAASSAETREPEPQQAPPAEPAPRRLAVSVANAPLVVWLPPEGSELNGERLTVLGRAAAGMTVSINGKPVEPGHDGRFATTLVLPAGDAEVTVRGERDGESFEITRRYRVPAGEWFLLAMADTAIGVGNQIVGMNEDTTLELDGFDDEVYLHGRAVAYLKGRVKGKALLESSPFDELRVTAHVDTGKEEDPELLRQLIDPDRYYPVYGDAVEEVQDVRSREKLYVLLEADRSKLQVGNFRAQLNGQQLFQYQRTFFGASVDIDHEFVDGARTELKAFAADGGAGTRHRQVVFQGTGGAMYFLRDDAIVEGSERVQLVIRDAVSGARLMVIPQLRDVDYTMQYRDGRLMFMQPVPSTVTAGWNINQNPVRTLDGHRVFLEIEYDYESTLGDESEDAYAFQLKQTFMDRITVGGGIVQEEREGSRYRLIGGEARAKLLEHTEIMAEFAFSEAVDIDTLASFDGGVTFGRIGSPEDVLSENGAQPVEGWAALFALRGDAEDLVAASGEPRELRYPYELTFQHQEPGFYSGTNVLEQGQTKFGVKASALLTDADSVRLRHDGVWSTLYLGNASQELNRQVSAVGYERKGNGWSAGAEVGHTLSSLDDNDPAHRATMNVFGRYQLTPRLTLLGEQELTQEFGTDETTLPGDARLQGSLDSLATTVGAEYRLTDELSITAVESLRWSGTNSAQIGIRARLMDDVDVYTSERFTTGAGRTVSTLVVGAESRAIPGSRSYGEYQLDHLSSGRSGRAVFGMENAWTVSEGLKLQLSYERAQLVADNTPLAPGATGFAISEPGVTGAGSGALSRDQQFSASSYAGGGVFPTGVSSRDAFAVGAEYLPNRDFKLGSRIELRYDRGDQRLETPDRLTVFGHLGGNLRFYDDFVALGRVRGAAVRRTDVDFDEGQFLDVSLGLALRPRNNNTYGGLMKWTRRYERRALGGGLTQFQLEVADVLSIEPWFELPYGFQLVGKGAVKSSTVVDADLPTVTSTVLLGIGRLNYHLSSLFDTGVEYRWTGNLLTDESEHGALVEFAWLPVEYASVGVGYNFTSFSDDLLDGTDDDHGFFLRVTGRF